MKKRTKIIGIIIIALLFLIAIYTTGCIGEENCGDCGGSGDCQNCGGDGSDWLETCRVCGGSGECEECGGDGRTMPGFELIGVALAIALCIGIIGWRKRKRR